MSSPRTTTDRFRAFGRSTLFLICCAGMLAVAAPLVLRAPAPWSNFVLGSTTSFGVLALSVLFVKWDGIRLEDIGIAPCSRSPLRFALGFLVGLLLVVIHAAVVGYACHARWSRSPGVGFPATAVAFVGYFALSCREELAFRGYPLRRLENPFGLWGCQLIVAFAFAVEHVAGGVNWKHAFLGAGIGSLFFGMAALATRGLAMPFGLHAAWNFGTWMLGEKGSPGIWKAMVAEGLQGRYELAETLTYIVIIGSATLVFWLRYDRMNASNRAVGEAAQRPPV